MQNFPMVSVCIPAYNSAATIAETLESVLAQDYSNLDIVVSDNNSTDRTKEVVMKYAENGVRYFLHEPGGSGANWDFVLTLGRGEFLCLFHSDDLFEPNMISEQIRVMQAHPNVGAVFTQRRMIGEDSHPIQMGLSYIPEEVRGRTVLEFPLLMNVLLSYTNFLSTPSVMLRKSAIEGLGIFDERRFDTSADLEMWMRIARKGYQTGVIEKPLLKYRISHRQGSEQYNKQRVKLADVFSVLDYYLSLPDVRAIATEEALRMYELRRAADQILCVMNLLAQNRIDEALAMLGEAVKMKHFRAASKRPMLFARMCIGVFFLVSARIGLGSVAGRLIYHSYLFYLKMLRKPMEE